MHKKRLYLYSGWDFKCFDMRSLVSYIGVNMNAYIDVIYFKEAP